MNNIENRKRDELAFPLNGSANNLPPPHASAVTAFTIIFLIMMAIPASIAIAMLFTTLIAVCVQARVLLNNTNRRIKQLEGILLISSPDKKRIEIDNGTITET